MFKNITSRPLKRQTVVKAGLAIGALQVASPFRMKALGEVPIKNGLDDPFTGTHTELGPLTAGEDAANSLKEAVEFGLDKKFLIAGAQQELEVLEGLPPEVALMPDKVFARPDDHQLMPDLYVGQAVPRGPVPEDLFHVDKIVKGVNAALPVSSAGYDLTWPTV